MIHIYLCDDEEALQYRIWGDGFSTKGEGRGLGLPGYQRISSGYPNTSASTSWAGGVFIQELNVEDRS